MKYLFAFVFAFSFGALASCTPVFISAQTIPNNLTNSNSGQTLRSSRSNVTPTNRETQNSTISLAFVPNSMSSEWRRWESILSSTKSNHVSGEMTAKQLVEELIEIGLPVTLDASASDDALPEDESIEIRLPGRSVRTRLLVALREKNACIAFKREHIAIVSIDDAEDVSSFSIITYDVSGFGVNPHELLDSIQNTIQPDSWQDTGQGLATIEYTSMRGRDLFTIAQNYENHLAIQDYLEGLNRLTGQKQVRNKIPRKASPLNNGAGATPVSATNAPQNNGRMFGGSRN